MFSKITKLSSNGAVVDINAAVYVFHERPIEGTRMMRATTAALLLDTGELFIGCACASEGDQFERSKGRSLALVEAEAKLVRWLRKSQRIKPDQILAVKPDYPDKTTWHEVNGEVQKECLYFLIDRFRLLLFKRYAIIASLNDELDKIYAGVMSA